MFLNNLNNLNAYAKIIDVSAVMSSSIDVKKAYLKLLEASIPFSALPPGVLIINALKQDIEASEKLLRLVSA